MKSICFVLKMLWGWDGGGLVGSCRGGSCKGGVGYEQVGWGGSFEGGVGLSRVGGVGHASVGWGDIQSNLVIEAHYHHLHTLPPGNYWKLLGEQNSITTTHLSVSN